MGEEITYSLCEYYDDSDEYYKDVSIFTDEVIGKICNVTNVWVKDFQNFIVENCIEDLRSNIEHSLELLILGVLWKTYINKAIILKRIPKDILIKLSKLREKNSVKKQADFFRGILETLFLDKEDNKDIDFTLDNLIKLIDFLSATGEFKQEVKRLEIWKNYLYNKSKNEVSKIILVSVNLGEWFEIKSEERLGNYTKNVNKFHSEDYKKYKWREDYIYCGRKRIEYHLNMVGAEIMNRTYREDFLKTKEKRLLLPSCMRLKSDDNCKAIKTKEGYLCKNCSKLCKVRQYTELGRQNSFKVYIIPHESSAFTKEKAEIGYIGIIGVACVLNLISGGWKAKDLGFIPQCVLLDYCGCKSHWHKEGIITGININRLLHTIGKSK